MTATLLEPSLSARHTAPEIHPALRSAGVPTGTPIDLAGVRDLSVRAAIADMNEELASTLSTSTMSFFAADVITSVRNGVAVVVARVVDALAAVPQAPATALVSPESAYDAVQYVADVLGLPKTDVTAAAGIAQRTYHSWASGGTPRIQSQGSLWRLVHTAEDLLELIGSHQGVLSWIRSDPARREAFRTGQVDRLLADAVLQFTPAPAEDPVRDAIAQLGTAGGDRYTDEDAVPARRRAAGGWPIATRSAAAVRAGRTSPREGQE